MYDYPFTYEGIALTVNLDYKTSQDRHFDITRKDTGKFVDTLNVDPFVGVHHAIARWKANVAPNIQWRSEPTP